MKIIENISYSQLSIARYYGGANIDGVYYHYCNQTDRLIRYDYWKQYKRLNKPIKNEENKPKKNNENNQLNLEL